MADLSELSSSCPVDCPNRKPAENSLKAGAYIFALITTLFLTFQAVSAERRNEELSPGFWMPCLFLIGGALGVPINLSQLSSVLSSGTKK